MRSRSCPRSQRRSKPRRARADRSEAEELVAERVVRRRERDFAAADAIRERLRAGGWEVLDSAEGSELQALKAPAPTQAAPVARAVTSAERPDSMSTSPVNSPGS